MDSTNAAISATPRRQPPEIIFVPPPERGPTRPVVIVVVIGVSVLAGAIMYIAVGPPIAGGARIFAALLFLAMGVFFAVVLSIQNRMHKRRRAAFLAERPIDESDPRVAALGELWSRSGRRSRFVNTQPGPLGAPRLRIGVGADMRAAHRLPSVDKVREALCATQHSKWGGPPCPPARSSGGHGGPPHQHERLADTPPGLNWPETPDDAPPATIISFGEPDVPEVGELHFEPEIITPTGAVWKQLFWVLPAAVLIAWWMLDYMNWLPPWIPDIGGMLGAFAYFFVSAAIVLATWAWKGMFRPTYIRMAPGVIQVLRFGYSKSKPTIRSYPVEPNTLAVFTRLGRNLVLTLSRGENQDTLSFSRMSQTKRRIERAWQALLSTAPTPPLSEEGLVG